MHTLADTPPAAQIVIFRTCRGSIHRCLVKPPPGSHPPSPDHRIRARAHHAGKRQPPLLIRIEVAEHHAVLSQDGPLFVVSGCQSHRSPGQVPLRSIARPSRADRLRRTGRRVRALHQRCDEFCVAWFRRPPGAGPTAKVFAATRSANARFCRVGRAPGQVRSCRLGRIVRPRIDGHLAHHDSRPMRPHWVRRK